MRFFDLAPRPQAQSFPRNIGRNNMYVFWAPTSFLNLKLSDLIDLGDEDEPEWMVEFAKRDSRRAITEKRQEFEARLARIRQDEERLKQSQNGQERPRKKQVWFDS